MFGSRSQMTRDANSKHESTVAMAIRFMATRVTNSRCVLYDMFVAENSTRRHSKMNGGVGRINNNMRCVKKKKEKKNSTVFRSRRSLILLPYPYNACPNCVTYAALMLKKKKKNHVQ